MQDVDFEMKYESGEIHIRFIVRHLLPIIGNKDIEKVESNHRNGRYSRTGHD